MNKKYIVELTAEECSTLEQVVSKLKGSSQKVKRARILLKADAGGPGWTDAKIAEALDCRTKTVENVRQRFVEQGFEIALNGKRREKPPGKNCSTVSRRPRSLPCDLANLRRATASGPFVYWPARW